MSRHPSHPAVRRRTMGAAALAAALTSAACTIPSDAPILEQRWNVPAKSTTIGVAELLPANVTVSGGAFAIAVTAPAAVSRTLFQDCAACQAANGQTVPKPAFTASTSTATSLPADIASATLTGGTLTVQIRNNYAFDPLRPSATERGSIVVRVANGATVLGTTTVSGTTQSLAPGTTLSVAVPLTGAISGASPVTVTADITSPLGDPVTMTSAQSVTVTPSISNLTVASAQVRVAARTISTTSTVDLSDVDSELGDRIDSAYVRLSITNPFAVSGTLNVSLEAPGATTVTRAISLVASASNNEQVIVLRGDEMRRFIGTDVTLRIAGPVSAAGNVTVTPSQVVSVATRLDLFLALGR